MESQDKSKKSKKRRKVEKKFYAQIICPCKKRCAQRIDVVTQQDISNKYYALDRKNIVFAINSESN